MANGQNTLNDIWYEEKSNWYLIWAPLCPPSHRNIKICDVDVCHVILGAYSRVPNKSVASNKWVAPQNCPSSINGSAFNKRLGLSEPSTILGNIMTFIGDIGKLGTIAIQFHTHIPNAFPYENIQIKMAANLAEISPKSTFMW